MQTNQLNVLFIFTDIHIIQYILFIHTDTTIVPNNDDNIPTNYR
jgi:hypothetical protein